MFTNAVSPGLAGTGAGTFRIRMENTFRETPFGSCRKSVRNVPAVPDCFLVIGRCSRLIAQGLPALQMLLDKPVTVRFTGLGLHP